MNKGTLYIIPSAIAPGTSQENVNERVREVIKGTQHFVVEHSRESRRYISSLHLGINIESLQLSELNQHTSINDIGNMLAPLLEGHDLGLMSDAGCPGIADPGAELVRAAHNQFIKVVPLVGPSSIILSLMASGLSGQNFCFTGYLPIDKKELKHRLVEMEGRSRNYNETQVFIETPYRSDRMLNELLDTLNPSTLLTIAKNITARDEQIITLPVSQWQRRKVVIGKNPSVFLFLST